MKKLKSNKGNERKTKREGERELTGCRNSLKFQEVKSFSPTTKTKQFKHKLDRRVLVGDEIIQIDCNQ
ncbi:hypothetical protein Sjap_024909 [Stephania japonica]|uniref:Uncharacterized protein n=1 Tax=Stephania japonica TaxID=461633 RepID=A0AAP0EHG5_9MAGN